jgi:hypothetical protein
MSPDGSYNVSDNDHIQNRGQHPVYHQILAVQQPGELSEVPDSEEEIEDCSESESVPARKRAKQNLTSSIQYETHSRAMQLEFYPGTWANILEHAKQLFCVWLVTVCAWPNRATHLVVAENCIAKAIEKYQRSKIEEGESRLDCKSLV